SMQKAGDLFGPAGRLAAGFPRSGQIPPQMLVLSVDGRWRCEVTVLRLAVARLAVAMILKRKGGGRETSGEGGGECGALHDDLLLRIRDWSSAIVPSSPARIMSGDSHVPRRKWRSGQPPRFTAT